jgi:outer membrane protein OmpA-like peptidoglycan-associated protein/ABC-type nitrate/sulfonate/bicarbonate transport system substrate-binding protein
MSTTSSYRLLAVAAVWLVLLCLAVAAYQLVVYWQARNRYREQVARYDSLVQRAKQLGVRPEPEPLPPNANLDAVTRLVATLEARIAEWEGTVPAAPPAGAPRQHVRLALDSFSGYCLFRSAEFRRELAAQGIELELVDDKADYAARFKALQAGRTPLAVFTIDALLKAGAAANDLPGTIVLLIDETRGADAMVAYKKAVPNLDALNRPEARIVATRDSPSETLARVVTAQFSLPRLAKDCWVDARDAADVYQKFQAGDPGLPWAFALWEPYVSKALEIPDSHVLIDSSRFRGYIVDVLVAQRRFLLNNDPLVEAVVKAYLRTLFLRRQESAGMVQAVLEDVRQLGESLTNQQAARLVEGIWWKNTQENYAHLGIRSGARGQDVQPLAEMIRNLTDVLRKTQAIARDPTGGRPDALYSDKVLRRLHGENFHPEETIQADRELEPLSEDQWQRLEPVGTLQVEPLVFARGTAELTAHSKRVLGHLVETLKTWPRYYLEVRGHARPEGDPEANRLLAEQRARAAAEFLAAQAVPRPRLRPVPTEPRAAGGQAQSVSFVFLQKAY